MYLTAAFEEKVAIEAVTHAPVRYNHESVESGHTGFDVSTVQRGFYLKSSQKCTVNMKNALRAKPFP